MQMDKRINIKIQNTKHNRKAIMAVMEKLGISTVSKAVEALLNLSEKIIKQK